MKFDGDRKPQETRVATWDLDTDADGAATQRIAASEAGQFRLSFTVTDRAGHAIEGGYVFIVRGENFDGEEFRFNDLELTINKAEYRPGDTVELMINTDRPGSTVALFVRPAGGVYLPPKILRLRGKSTVHEIGVASADMPNFFVEAFTVSDGRVHVATREVIVPPEKRILNVDVLPSKEEYRPGDDAKVQVRLTDFDGKPFTGSAVVTVYDKALEYIAGGSNVPKIEEFFWKWRRAHHPETRHSLEPVFTSHALPGRPEMAHLGVFGHSVADELTLGGAGASRARFGMLRANGREAALASSPMPASAPMGAVDSFAMEAKGQAGAVAGGAGETPAPLIEPMIRSNFADTAFWAAALETDAAGLAEISLAMPENLTTWKVKTWALGHGTRVGEGEVEVITTKNLLLRLQAPRFFVEKDEVVLSANVHNYLESPKDAQVALELEGDTLALLDPGAARRTVRIEPGGEARIDWRVRVVEEGEAVVRMKALTDEESDAMEMRFPVFVHGILKTESWSGAIRPASGEGGFAFRVPDERRPKQTRLELRWSPTIAGAMVDALPYLASYPYGCTEQTLNRFLPTVITQRLLLETGVDLAEVRKKRTNLNPQQIGNDRQRARDWGRDGGSDANPVWDEEEVRRMAKAGVERLTAMQNSDGGWGWFSGYRETSQPHTTAQVVRGLLVARENGVAIVPGVIESGVAWLKRHEAAELKKIRNEEAKKNPRKAHADDTDALLALVLAQAGAPNKAMLDFLYRDRNKLSVYAKAMIGIVFDGMKDIDRRDMILRNLSQYLVEDAENQTAYLKLDNGNYWWFWFGSEFEAHAFYLKLLARTDPKGTVAPGIVKYLVNNRSHASHWNSTRDTALCIEAIAEYYRASGEDKVDLEIDVLVDGKVEKTVAITNENLFTFDNKLILRGGALEGGEHAVSFRKRGAGPLYYNGYLENFTLEDFIEGAGLEIKVERAYYKIVGRAKQEAVAGSRGQAASQTVAAEERIPIDAGVELVSGDVVEVEFVVESKNDYEYIVIEDWKPAGLEAEEVRSGYVGAGSGVGGGMRAYMELRDEKAVFFLQQLPRGRHSLRYRLRAEIPGKFSALPTQVAAMYAPELKANADEMKLGVRDRER